MGVRHLDFSRDPLEHNATVLGHPARVVVAAQDVSVVLGVSIAISHGDGTSIIEEEEGDCKTDVGVDTADLLDQHR